MTDEILLKIATVNCGDDERKEIHDAIKKQIPQKPLMVENENKDKGTKICGITFKTGTIYKCRNCEMLISRHKYCQECGQLIDWSNIGSTLK